MTKPGPYSRRDQLKPGMVLGGCVLERVLERGYLGTLWLAYEPDRDRQVTLKVYHPAQACGEEFRVESQRLAEAVATLSHPHLVRVLRFTEDPPYRFLVREFQPGTRLDSVLREERHRPKARLQGGWVPTVCRWGAQIAEGLDHAHRLGILHRALWPGNIGIGTDGKARAFDFWTGAARSPVVVTCLRGYLAPEEEWQGPVGPAADVFSLGAVLYRCLAGTLPYPVLRTPSEDKVFFDRPPRSLRRRVPELAPGVEAAVLRALELDPEGRPASAGAVAAARRRFPPASGAAGERGAAG